MTGVLEMWVSPNVPDLRCSHFTSQPSNTGVKLDAVSSCGGRELMGSVMSHSQGSSASCES